MAGQELAKRERELEEQRRREEEERKKPLPRRESRLSNAETDGASGCGRAVSIENWGFEFAVFSDADGIISIR